MYGFGNSPAHALKDLEAAQSGWVPVKMSNNSRSNKNLKKSNHVEGAETIAKFFSYQPHDTKNGPFYKNLSSCKQKKWCRWISEKNMLADKKYLNVQMFFTVHTQWRY